MRQHLRCNLLFGLIGHFGLLKDIIISFFLSSFCLKPMISTILNIGIVRNLDITLQFILLYRYIKASGPVTCIDWSPSGANLLIGCSNGQVLEVPRPGTNEMARILKSF